MRTVFQLAKLVKDDLQGRGLIQEIADYTGLERHTISALLHNTAKYVSLDSIGRICDYLVDQRSVDPNILPGALFGKKQDGFWAMLANRKYVHFALATRTHREWPDTEYVMANDAHLQGVLVGQVSALDMETARDRDAEAHEEGAGPQAAQVAQAPAPNTTDEREDELVGKRLFAHPHLVPAPRRVRNEDNTGWITIHDGQQRAMEIYREFQNQSGASVMFTLGSVKVNGVLDVLASEIFNTTPFVSQDDVQSPRDRSCPFYFRYREHDPAPESLCGGTQLSKSEPGTQPGIYYETEKEGWKCCPCERGAHDVAFVLYAYRPPADELQLACGGFSGIATRFLAERFTYVASQFWEPQFRSGELEVGLFLVTFDIRKSTRGGRRTTNAGYNHRVIAIDEEVLTRRLHAAE